MPEVIGSGCALFDCDNDGDLDAYFVNCGLHVGSSQDAHPNRLYVQDDAGRFADATAESGLGDTGYGMGVAVGDYDNDGDADVYVMNYGPDALYRNNGDGTFSNVTASAGIDNKRWACSAAFVDFDLDGFLDLFVANYVDYPKPVACTDDAGRPEYCGPEAFPGTADVLYRNNGDGTFADVSAASGIDAVAGKGLGVVCDDFDGDGRPEIYVANDGEANFLWLNNGDGTFTESAMIRGAALNAMANPEASMGVTAGDVDGDGDLDLFMTHLVNESNTMYVNDGNGRFDDVTGRSGIGAMSFPFTGFGTAFLDFDSDGFLDLIVGNGRVKRGPRLPESDPNHPLAAYAEPNHLYQNDGTGRFQEVSDRAPALRRPAHVSRGLAIGDVDRDGDVDVLVSNCGGPAQLFRNDVDSANHWLIVRAIDPGLRRDAIGARITIAANGRQMVRTISAGYSYASASPPFAHFGLGAAPGVESIEIRWPGGEVQTFPGERAGQMITLERTRRGS